MQFIWCINSASVKLHEPSLLNFHSRSMQSEMDKAWLVMKRLLQRVEMDPDALRVFVQILGKKQAKYKPVIHKLGGSK